MTQGGIVMAMIWMAVLSLLLFWLPLFGPLIAGFVGGRVAGSTARGLLAALLPALALCAVLAASIGMLSGMPVISFVASLGLFAVLLLQSLPLLAGAVIGGAMV